MKEKTKIITGEEHNTFVAKAEPGRIYADFSNILQEIKPLHGICNSRRTYGEPLPEILEAGIPYTRLHDTFGEYGGNSVVDIPNIFRDFDADPDDPASYDFAFTDAYLQGLAASGLKIVYRLGVTIENGFNIKPLRIAPPADYLKWAKICAHIIRHYNYGWANGFHYNIEYWEIWNEPEQPSMWSGTRDDYLEFYKVAATYLKEQFPELKIGGYACSGFCAYANKEAAKNPKYYSFLTFFDAFLDFVRRENLPFDFFSWHYYPKTAADLLLTQEYAEKKLEEYGFGHVEIIIDEWNYMDWSIEDRFDAQKEMPGATCVASVFCTMQKQTRVAKMMYYDGQPASHYGGLYYFPSEKVSKTYYVLRMFNTLYRLGHEVYSVAPETDNVFALAATDGSGRHAMLITNINGRERFVEISAMGVSGRPECTVLDSTRVFLPTAALWQNDGRIRLPGMSVILLEWR